MDPVKEVLESRSLCWGLGKAGLGGGCVPRERGECLFGRGGEGWGFVVGRAQGGSVCRADSEVGLFGDGLSSADVNGVEVGRECLGVYGQDVGRGGEG